MTPLQTSVAIAENRLQRLMRQRNPATEEKPSNGETQATRSPWRSSRKSSHGSKRGETARARSSSLRRTNASQPSSPEDQPYNLALRGSISRRGSRANKVDGESNQSSHPRTEGDYSLRGMTGVSSQGLQLSIPSDSSDISSLLSTPTSICHTPRNFTSAFGDPQTASPVLPDSFSGRSRSSDWGSPSGSRAKLDVYHRSLSSPNLLSASFRNATEPQSPQSLAISLRGPTGDWEAVLAVYDPGSSDSLLNQRIADRLGLEAIPMPREKTSTVRTPYGILHAKSVVYNIGLKEGGGLAGNPVAGNIAVAPFRENEADIIIGRKMMEKLRNAGASQRNPSVAGSPWIEPASMGISGVEFPAPRYSGEPGGWLPDPGIELGPGTMPFQQPGLPVPFPRQIPCISTNDQMLSGVCGTGPESYGGWNMDGFPPVGPRLDMEDDFAYVGMNRM